MGTIAVALLIVCLFETFLGRVSHKLGVVIMLVAVASGVAAAVIFLVDAVSILTGGPGGLS